MCIVSRCCLCLPLRAGVYLAMGYSQVLGVLTMVGCIWYLILLPSTRERLIEKVEQDYPHYTKEQVTRLADAGLKVDRIIFGVCIFVYGLWVILATIMSVGLRKMQRGYLMPWIVMTWILFVVGIAGFIFTINVAVTTGNDGGDVGLLVWLQMGVLASIVLCNGFGASGVQSFYCNNLKESNERLIEHEMPPATDFPHNNMA